MLVDTLTSGQALAAVRRSWRERGSAATILAIVQIALRPLIRLRRRLVYSAQLDASDSPNVWESGVQLWVIGPENITALDPELLASIDPDQNQQEWTELLKGNRLFVAAKGKQWLHRGSIRLTNTDTPDQKAVFFGELQAFPEIRWCETAPSARGKGLYRRVLHEQLRYLSSLGYSRAVLYIMAENIASIKGATAAGFQLCRTLHDWIVLNSLVFQRVHENGSARWRMFRQ